MTITSVTPPTARCRECLCRVPVTRLGYTVRHWHRSRMAVPDRPSLRNPEGLRWIDRRLMCPGWNSCPVDGCTIEEGVR